MYDDEYKPIGYERENALLTAYNLVDDEEKNTVCKIIFLHVEYDLGFATSDILKDGRFPKAFKVTDHINDPVLWQLIEIGYEYGKAIGDNRILEHLNKHDLKLAKKLQ